MYVTYIHIRYVLLSEMRARLKQKIHAEHHTPHSGSVPNVPDLVNDKIFDDSKHQFPNTYLDSHHIISIHVSTYILLIHGIPHSTFLQSRGRASTRTSFF